ncbi:TetR/AcrR family transcriptional regulator [Nocardia africana]|uniref:Transcriptional repressor BetI n=1 Tax=Nocardia africana TaxID=134964 RepID=A0A378WJI6_9NOCA|nr:TetR family transcriptional regulator [Nocardia africana]MCC3316208.1 TetR family transcriptional regulator [Nocardia africana]SUA41446.1 transcriptional repressor BetI [Nocardia africana]
MSTPPPAGRPGATHPGTNVRRPAGDGRATDRRGLIVGTAIDLIAREGLRALTHRALDTEAGLPSGSTSYYFRTKRALVEAIVDAITERSRTDFRAGGLPVTGADDIAAAVATWLDDLLAQRRNHLIARHMLITDLLGDPDLHSRLVASLFSHRHARELFRSLGAADPDTAAADYIAVIEGLVFDRFAGARKELAAGTRESAEQLARPLRAQLRAAIG